jgi:hypothetical protein
VFALWSDLANQNALRVTFNDGAPGERKWHRSQGLASEHRREDACVGLRPEGVVFALRNAVTNDASFPVGKFRRTRDAAIIAEPQRPDLHD